MSSFTPDCSGGALGGGLVDLGIAAADGERGTGRSEDDIGAKRMAVAGVRGSTLCSGKGGGADCSCCLSFDLLCRDDVWGG